MLTEEEKQDYISSPNHCPYCRSENIEGQGFEGDEYGATQKVSCKDCGKRWKEGLSVDSIFEEEEQCL